MKFAAWGENITPAIREITVFLLVTELGDDQLGGSYMLQIGRIVPCIGRIQAQRAR